MRNEIKKVLSRLHLVLVLLCLVVLVATSCGGQLSSNSISSATPSPSPSSVPTDDSKSLVELNPGVQLSAQDSEELKKHSPEDLLKEIRAREQSALIDLAISQSQIHASVESADLSFSPVRLNSALARFSSQTLVLAVLDQQKALYGEDNRKEVFVVASNPSFARAADAVVSLFQKSRVIRLSDGQNSKIVRKDYGTEFNLCTTGSQTEPFLTQPCSAYCSGVLVGPDLVATAGHCIHTPEKPAPVLSDIYFVFGYRMRDPDTAELVIRNDEIYTGVEIVKQVYSSSGQDFALIRLDRQVSTHRPVPIRRSAKISDHEDVYVIGHPCGLPAKFADGAVVRDNTNPNFFVANLDTYAGNSGSPVFNRTTNELEGILVRGEKDFVKRDPSITTSCRISLRCPNTGCRGEDCTRITLFASLIPAIQ